MVINPEKRFDQGLNIRFGVKIQFRRTDSLSCSTILKLQTKKVVKYREAQRCLSGKARFDSS